MADFTSNTDFDSWDDTPGAADTGTDPAVTSPPSPNGDASTSASFPTTDDTGAASDQALANTPDPAPSGPASSSPPRRSKLYGEDIARNGIDYYTAIGNGTSAPGADGSGQSNSWQSSAGQANSGQSVSLQAWDFGNGPFSSYQFRTPGAAVPASNTVLPSPNSDLASPPGYRPSYSFPSQTPGSGLPSSNFDFRSPGSYLLSPLNPLLPSWSFERPDPSLPATGNSQGSPGMRGLVNPVLVWPREPGGRSAPTPDDDVLVPGYGGFLSRIAGYYSPIVHPILRLPPRPSTPGGPWRADGTYDPLADPDFLQNVAQPAAEARSPSEFPVTDAQRKLQAAQQVAADSRQRTGAALHSLGVPPTDASGVPLDLDTTDGDALRAHVDDSFDQESASAEANARRLWSFDGTDLTSRAQALRTDIERRRAQAQAALGDHLQARDAVQKASDQFDQVRAPYAVDNVRQLQALNLQRIAAGQPPVPVPPEWLRLAALANPPSPQTSSPPASASAPQPDPSSPTQSAENTPSVGSPSVASPPPTASRDPSPAHSPSDAPAVAAPANPQGASTTQPAAPVRISSASSGARIPAPPRRAGASSRSAPDPTPNVATDLINRIGLGAFHGLERAGEGITRFVGLDGLADWFKDEAEYREKQLAGQVFNGTEQYVNPKANAVSQTVGRVGAGLLENVPAIALGGIPGLITLGIQAMGEASATAHDQAKAQGACDEDATKAAGIAALKTLPQTALYALAGTATRGLLKNIQPLVASPLGRAAAAFLAGTAGNLAAGSLSKFFIGANPRPSVDDIVNALIFAGHGARTEHQIGQNLATARAIVDGTHPDMAILDAVAQGKVPKATAEDRTQAAKAADAHRAVAQSYLRKASPDVPGYPLLDGAPPPGTQPFAHVSGLESPDHSASPQTIPGFPPASDGDAAASIPVRKNSNAGSEGAPKNSRGKKPLKPASPPLTAPKAANEPTTLPGKSSPPSPPDATENQRPNELKQGGAHGDLIKDKWDKKDSHHIPADEALAASGLKTNEGPALKMDPEDHKQTASYGPSSRAAAYRARQAELIRQGKFREAQQMDIDDIRSRFKDKYDVGIRQLQEYTNSLPEERLHPTNH